MLIEILIAIAAFVVGAATWTFAEYAIHNWWGHKGREKNEFSREHMAHHRKEHYFTPTRRKVQVAAVFIVPSALLFAWWVGSAGLSYVAGFTVMYVAYELMHRRCHTHPPRNFYGRWARRNHLAHHFMHANSNFGVTTPIWDIVFRTHRPIAQVRIPRKRVMEWLCDDNGEVFPQFASDYVLTGKMPKHVAESIKAPAGNKTKAAGQMEQARAEAQ